MKTANILRVSGSADWEQIPRIPISEKIAPTQSPVTAYAQICATEEALLLHLAATEPEIRAEETGMLGMPCVDSCLEFFFRPMEEELRYFNFEYNPNGSLFLGFGSCVEELLRIVPNREQQKALFQPRIVVGQEGWDLYFRVPYSFIRQFFPEFRADAGKVIYGNFYKCGELVEQPHFLAWNPIFRQGTSRFHTPAEFGRLDVV